MNLARSIETDRALGRMNVYIYLIRGQSQKEHDHRELSFHQASGIALHDGVIEHFVSNEATIHVCILPAGSCSRDLRKRDEPVDAEAVALVVYLTQLMFQAASQDLGYAVKRS